MAEVYDADMNEWSAVTSSVAGPRGSGLTATMLTDGRVLIVGGAHTALELYDPDSGGPPGSSSES